MGNEQGSVAPTAPGNFGMCSQPLRAGRTYDAPMALGMWRRVPAYERGRSGIRQTTRSLIVWAWGAAVLRPYKTGHGPKGSSAQPTVGMDRLRSFAQKARSG
jgi:hypothetical protein